MHHNIQPIPASEQHLCQYIAYLAMAGLAHSTIKCYLSAVRHLHIAEDAGDPGISRMPRLEQVLRGVKRTQARSKSKVKERLPITIEILDTLRKFWSDKGSAEAGMLWATASLCFFGFFRSGELTVPTEAGYEAGAHLGVQDVRVDCLANPQILQVTLRASKTDPFRAGVDVFVGRTNCPLCPVAAVLSYRVSRGPRPGPMF